MCGTCYEDRPLNADLKCDMPETLTYAMLAQLEGTNIDSPTSELGDSFCNMHVARFEH